jgi:catechol 2,3-dioxygenase-like lactoylglutathione lyase family enzyme
MFSGAHVTLYSQDAEADRAFVADVLGFPHVDAGASYAEIEVRRYGDVLAVTVTDDGIAAEPPRPAGRV